MSGSCPSTAKEERYVSNALLGDVGGDGGKRVWIGGGRFAGRLAFVAIVQAIELYLGPWGKMQNVEHCTSGVVGDDCLHEAGHDSFEEWNSREADYLCHTKGSEGFRVTNDGRAE